MVESGEIPLLNKKMMDSDKSNLERSEVLIAELTKVLNEIRNWLKSAPVDRIEEYIQLARQTLELPAYSLDRIKWVQAEGPKGAYEYADRNDNLGNEDFKALIEDLKRHDGRMTRQGYFLWLFSQEDRVGRKPRREGNGK